MDIVTPNSQEKLLTLQETAKQLAVSVDVLLKWNDYHILTPKITLTGQIGYTQEQINQFLTIQHTFQSEKIDLQIPSSAHLATPKSGVSLKFLSGLFTLSGISFFLIFIAWHTLLSSFSTLGGTDLATNGASAQLEQGLNSAQTQPKTNADNSLQQSASQNSSLLAAEYPSKKSPGTTIPSTQKKQVLATSAAAFIKSQQQKVATGAPQSSPSEIGDGTTYASIAQSNKHTSTNIIDSNGQIVGSAGKSNQLASILSAGHVTPDEPTQITTDIRTQGIFLTLLLGMAFVGIIKKPKPIVRKAVVQPIIPVAKVLEVHQKMDGTVYLLFQGKEYKISKPELDSDSDRFIERLFQLIPIGEKEMEYESLTDTIRLTTPLSRIVTRLGFVGLKRDLFFPRTSKHRVLFRKYVTQRDLDAMNISISQIQQDVVHIFS